MPIGIPYRKARASKIVNEKKLNKLPAKTSRPEKSIMKVSLCTLCVPTNRKIVVGPTLACTAVSSCPKLVPYAHPP